MVKKTITYNEVCASLLEYASRRKVANLNIDPESEGQSTKTEARESQEVRKRGIDIIVTREGISMLNVLI